MFKSTATTITAAATIAATLSFYSASATAGDLDVLDLPIEKPIRGRALQTPEPTPDPVEEPTSEPTADPKPDPKPDPEPANEPISEPPADVPQDEAPTFFGNEIETPSQSIIFVIDRSGSMWLKVDPFVGLDGQIVSGGNRLDRAKVELKRAIAALTDNFVFNIVFYDECVYAWQAARVQANNNNKSAAIAFVDQIQPDGWTNTGVAMLAALAEKENDVVVLLSDGAPNFLDCALTTAGDIEYHRALISWANSQGARIDAFGIGLDDLTRTFMMNVAADAGGSFTEVN